jgi:hypothetical protein
MEVVVHAAWEAITRILRKSVRSLAQPIGISVSTTWKIVMLYCCYFHKKNLTKALNNFVLCLHKVPDLWGHHMELVLV